jgi:tRNA nucleotidyltransferase (CCA-adding enzyme)
MHMPPRPRQAPIVAWDPIRQVRELWRNLTPREWPVPPEALPAGTALVGGAVRDGLLGRLPHRPDLDLVVNGDAIALARRLQGQLGGSCVVLDPQRSIARLVIRHWTIDLARLSGESLAADLARRDYKVNAIALPLPEAGEEPRNGLVDPLGGREDLAERRLVAISEANLLDDPLRLLRGVRLAAELEFRITAPTWEWICTHHTRIGDVAGERVLAELERLAAAPWGQRGLQQAMAAGLLQPWTGAGLEPEKRELEALERLDAARPTVCGLTPQEAERALPLARLAVLLDGASLARLRASRRLQQRCERLRRWQRRLQSDFATASDPLTCLGESERLELQRHLCDDLPALLLQLEPAVAQAALGRWRDPDDPLFHPRPPLDGESLQRRLGIAPGPRLGELLDHLSRERAFGRLPAQDDSGEQTLISARLWLAGKAGPTA